MNLGKNEAGFSLQAKGWLNDVYRSHTVKLTPFLTPREGQLLKGFAKSYDGVSLSFHGGFTGAERCRALILPAGGIWEDGDFSIGGFQIHYHKKFSSINHRQILGSLMGLQIDRSRIGDIILDGEGNAFFAIALEIAPYVQEHLLAIGSTTVRLNPMDLSGFIREEQWEESEIMVASMRLDAVVAAILKLSRSQVATYFKEGHIQINHQLEQNHSRACQIGDLFSIRKYGRCKILAQSRVTKNNKLVLLIGKAL